MKITGGGGGTDSLHKNIESKDEILTYKSINYDSLSDYEKQEGYIFHIFTEEILQSKYKDSKDYELESNLEKLQNELNKIYPCSIKAHYINDNVFKNCEKLKDSYATYYRLKIADLLDSNIKTALYLDCDMLVIKDIRALFTIDMESKFAYVVHDYFFHSQKIIYHKSDKTKFLTYDKNYFNAGFIYFNLESTRKINLWEQAQEIFNNYQIVFHDQDTINYIFKGNVGILSPCFDYMSFAFGCYPINIPKGENPQYCDMYYTREQLECGLENVVIYHYTPYKPWRHPLYPEVPSRYNYPRVLEAIHLWEKIAKITPVYSKEVQSTLDSIKENEFDNYTIFMAKKLENIESNFKKDMESISQNNYQSLRALRKKITKRINILITGEIILLAFIILLLLLK